MPDVLVIVTDDQNGETLARMPQVQKLLVARGTQFPNAMVPTPLCCPSRASLLTGRFAHSTLVWTNSRPTGGWWAFKEHGAEQRTLAVALRRRGYQTALVGKYFNSFGRWAPPGYRPPGWDSFTAFTTKRRSGDYLNYTLSDGSTHGTLAVDYSTDVLARAAVDFIGNATDGQPLFLYFAPYAPHSPYLPAQRHRRAWAGLPPYTSAALTEDVSDKPRWVRALGPPVRADRRAFVRRRQQEALMAVDEAVAAIVKALSRAGRLANSLIVFTSDNGFSWGDHRIFGKSVPYASSTRVPLVMRWDGRIPAGQVDPRLALNLDVTATLARAGSTHMRTDGLDLLDDHPRDGFVMEAAAEPRWGRPAYCGWRDARWSFVRYGTDEEELYDEISDPEELVNLASSQQHRDRIGAMRTMTREHCVPVPPGFSW